MNQILTNIESGILAHVSPENKQMLDKAVLAGQKIMFDPQTHANMELVKNPESRKTPVQTLSKGVAGLMWLMYMQSHKSMPPEVVVMAGTILMCKAIDFAERGLGIQFNNDMIAEAMKLLTEQLFTKMGVSPEQLQDAIQKGHNDIQSYHQDQQSKQGLLSQPTGA